MDLPYKIQYEGAELQLKICRSCSNQIFENDLVIAKMIQALRHDGKDAIWYHSHCFFQENSVSETNQIENFENIKYADQVAILAKIDPKKAEKCIKIARKRQLDKENTLENFGVDYASTDLVICDSCEAAIEHKDIRVKSVIYESEIAIAFGKEIRWYHVTCFAFNREMLKYPWDGKLLEGFDNLQPEHQVFVSEMLPPQVEQEVKKMRMNGPFHLNEDDLEDKIASQTEELVRIRQALQKFCSKDDLQFLLLMNEMEADDDMDTLLDRCADILAFGSLYKCQKCFKGDMIFTKYGYTCNAWVDEWIKCGNFQATPLRMRCTIPADLKINSFFATCEPKVEDRAVRPELICLDETLEPSTSMNIPGLKKKRVVKTASIQLKDGNAVDIKFKNRRQFHVYSKDGVLYTCVLGLTDIQKNKNSFYKLQVLESDLQFPGGHKYRLFTSWGRTGTDIGDNKTRSFVRADVAVAEFEKTYYEQTGNDWASRDKFVRIPGKFYPIDVKYEEKLEVNTSIASRHNPATQELMKLLFNINNMQVAMREYKLDLEKMPLGKLSVKQLGAARITLLALEEAVKNRNPRNELIGLSNKFFTLIPHSFGYDTAPVLDTIEIIDKKREMVDSLNDIENAYSMMSKAQGAEMNTYDSYYSQLNAKLELLDKNSNEFKMIERYVNNTSVHGYRITILEVFKLERFGEAQAYAAYENFTNRQLLWHGSRITNFASIIKNGLKISPQVNGSMFGRGLYFADMVSKSAQYCKAINHKNVGLLALCEVALGNIYQLDQASNLVGPPHGYHSVQGVGITQPDLNQAESLWNGVLVPLGKPIQAQQQFSNNVMAYYNGTTNFQPVNPIQPFNNIQYLQNQLRGVAVLGAAGLARSPGLQYNEFIVYNEKQVKLQYLVKFKQN